MTKNDRLAPMAARLRNAARSRGRLFVGIGIGVLTLAAVLKFSNEIPFIFWNPERGAIDLRYYFQWTHEWAAGADIYLRPDRPEYPPASLPLLYPLAGWLDWPQARILMGACSLCGIAALVAVALHGTRAADRTQAALAALLVLSNNGTGVALGNGQLSTLVVPLFLAALFLVHRRPSLWPYDVGAATMLTAALVKPSLTVPFLWLAMILPTAIRPRPLLLTGAAYALLTLFSLWFVGAPLLDGLLTPIRNGVAIAPTSLDPNIHYVLPRIGLAPLMLPATALAWLSLGLWIHRHRRLDLWLLLAVTALVARFWTYHRVYEDVLLLLPEIALWRIARRRREGDDSDVAAALLLAANALVLLAPGSLVDPPRWFQEGTAVAQGIVWGASFLFLLWFSERLRREQR